MTDERDVTYPGHPSRGVTAAYEASQARLAETMESCRYCKLARKLAGPKWDARWERSSYRWTSPDGTRSINGQTRERAIESAGCKEHRERRHLNFTTSPVSETYWSS